MVVLNIVSNNCLFVPGCPAQFKQYGSVCFHYTYTRMTSAAAAEYCSGLSATLPYPPTGPTTLGDWQRAVDDAIHDESMYIYKLLSTNY